MSESASQQDTNLHLWKRWPTGDRPPFHRYCELLPVRFRDGTLNWDWQRDGDPPVQIVPPAIRSVLRYTPLVVALTFAMFVLTNPAAITAVYARVLQGWFSWTTLVLLVLFGVWVAALLWLVGMTIKQSKSGMIRALVVYALLSGLAVGVGAVLVATVIARQADPTAQVTTFALDLWLTLLIGGMLVYDCILRAENMFGCLPWKHPSILNDTDGGYEDEFRAPLNDRLTTAVELSWPSTTDWRWSVPIAYVFAGLFVAPFAIIWLVGAVRTAPADLWPIAVSVVRIALLTAGSFVIVVVAYQFLLLVITFNELLTNHGPDAAESEAFRLAYNPFHPDEYGGFSDFGHLAMRVNALLLLGGLYHAVRVYLYGIPLLAEIQTTTALVVWGFNHIAPFVFYLGFVIYWLYLSLWKVHRVMQRGRELELKARTTDADSSTEETFLELKSAPVWPANMRKIYGVVSADIAPLFGLFPFVPT